MQYKHFQTQIEQGIFTITFNQENSKVNTLCEPVLLELEQILDEISCKIDIKAVVFKSAKDDVFIAGADINEIKDIKTQEDARKKVYRGQSIITKIEKLSSCKNRGFPVFTFAIINGACMGGGLELALACDFRICIENDKTKLALPEVNLGIIPGFGGCIRLPKIVGLINALPIILTGAPIDTKKAKKIGLVDAVFPSFNNQALIQKFIEGKIAKKQKPVRHVYLIQKYLRHFILSKAKSQVIQNTKGFYPAPLVAINVLSKTFSLCFSQKRALKIELNQFCNLCITDTNKNLIHLFFSTEALKKNDFNIDKSVKEKTINEVSVLGAGVMGGGIAWLFSKINIPVKMKDINLKAIGIGYAQIAKIYKSMLKKRKIKPNELTQKYNLISHTIENKDIAASDLVIEAVVEDRFVGMHFFNPVNIMPWVVVI